MWLIGIVVCVGFMLAGHGLMGSHRGSHSGDDGVARERVEAETPQQRGSAAESTTESAPQPQPGHRH